ncbi:hypothetical protein BKG96_09620 [Rodentibacter caecimuris]|uniref:HTH araC/xylS-type domain-containing protein n=1 Tax=Rodentibacter caecimuris TaxID=1796644 RepID=A0A1V3KI28_9PAST|nr:helix-turn-helix domain-containing protein [Rodentibacter heylii]OOF76813.1 hypothetical protein BKG96_09620 [Rodentibacter heylii]
MKIILKLLSDNSEIVQSYLPNIKIGIQCNKLSYFDEMKALCHWHEDIELVKIISGKMNYYVNGKIIHLNEGDGIIINSRAMHYGYSKNSQDCDFICVLINPSIFGTMTPIYQKFIAPILKNVCLDAYPLLANHHEHQAILNDINMLGKLYIQSTNENKQIDLACLSTACSLWNKWFELIKTQLTLAPQTKSKEIILQKKMVNFIYDHYTQFITLDEIAQSANICRSLCCRLFKKYVQQTPNQFLNAYRVERAKMLFHSTSTNVTNVAYQCGFNNLSYFAKQFEKIVGTTPKKYQQQCKEKYG